MTNLRQLPKDIDFQPWILVWDGSFHWNLYKETNIKHWNSFLIMCKKKTKCTLEQGIQGAVEAGVARDTFCSL